MNRRTILLLSVLLGIGACLFCSITGYLLYLGSYHERESELRIELSSYDRFHTSTPESPTLILPSIIPPTLRWYVYREVDYFAAPFTPYRGSVGVIFSGWTKTNIAELERQNLNCAYSLFMQNGDSYPFAKEYGAVGAVAENKAALYQCLIAAAEADQNVLLGIDIEDQ